MNSQGVLYVATGDAFQAEASRSLASLRVWMPALPAAIVSDQKPPEADWQWLILARISAGARDKIAGLLQSPFERTLYLDTDTHICGDISELFALLDRFDIALAHAPRRGAVAEGGIPESFPEFNGGVITFRRSARVEAVLRRWLEVYERILKEGGPTGAKGPQDQPSLREALYHSDLRIATLTPEYNCRLNSHGRASGFLSGPVKILHGRHPHLAELADKLNQGTHQRLHLMSGGVLQVLAAKDAL